MSTISQQDYFEMIQTPEFMDIVESVPEDVWEAWENSECPIILENGIINHVTCQQLDRIGITFDQIGELARLINELGF